MFIARPNSDVKYLFETPDIHQYPIEKYLPEADEELTQGDLHANPIYLLFVLIRMSVIDLKGSLEEKVEQYKQLVAIYKKSAVNNLGLGELKQFVGNQQIKNLPFVTNEDTANFLNIIRNIVTVSPIALFRLMGDEVCDRNGNDWYMQEILKQLDHLQVPHEILASNHGLEYIAAFENKIRGKTKKFSSPHMLRKDLTISLDAMQHLIERGIVSEETIFNNHENHYKPKLKLVGYSLSKDKKEITLYHHAGNGIRVIAALAKKLGTTFAAHSAEQLAKSIDAINAKYQEHVQNNTVYTLYHSHAIVMALFHSARFWSGTPNQKSTQDEFFIKEGFSAQVITECSIENNPFEYLIWNRRYDLDERPSLVRSQSNIFSPYDYKINYVHGHDIDDPLAVNIYNAHLPESQDKHIFNLDALLGKCFKYNAKSLFILSARNGEISLKLENEKVKNDNSLEDDFVMVGELEGMSFKV